MYFFKRLCCVFLLSSLVSNCAIETDPKLAADVSLLRAGVTGLARIIDDQYEIVEKVNRGALLDSLNLQYDLGGTPDIRLHRLFSVEERNSRLTVLLALQIYVSRLDQVLKQGGPSQIMQESTLVANNLLQLRPEKLDLSYALDRFQTRNLVSSLSSFSKLLLIPKRDREIAKIALEADPYVKNMALLFYLDIGAPEDQNETCRFTVLDSFAGKQLRELTLCRGGLRGLLATAIAANTVTWHQKLLLLATEKPVNKEKRAQYIQHLLAVQQKGQQQDIVFQETQLALTDLVSAHSELVTRLNGGIPGSLTNILDIKEQPANSIDLFANSVARLERLSKEAGILFAKDKRSNI